METSEHINELAAALAAAQGELKTAPKTAVNNAFKTGSKYATLADCITTALPTLSKHKLALIQGIHGTEFIARLVHASGQWIQQRVPLPGNLQSITIQQLGAMTTYLRRQTTGIFGLVPDEDDDGNEAAKVGGWNHKPLDKDALDPRVDALAIKYAKAYIAATTAVAAQKIEADMRNEVDENEVKWGDLLAMSVWAKIPKSEDRTRIKKLLAQKVEAAA